MLKVFVRKLLMPKNYFSPLRGKSVQKKKKKKLAWLVEILQHLPGIILEALLK